MKRQPAISGFSFVELLMVLAIVAIVSLFSVPAYRTFYATAQSDVIANQFLRAIQQARSQSQALGVPVIFCQSVDHMSCSGSWSDGQMILAEDTKKTVLALLNIPHGSGAIHWRSSLNQAYLRLYPDGTTHSTAGMFWYCAPGAKHPAWEIRINFSGRVRLIASVDKAMSCLV